MVCGSSECGSLFKCDKFKQINQEQRFEVARQNRLCFNCLKRNHSSAECRVESACTANGCKIKHTKFLHIDHFQRDRCKKQSEISNNKNERETEAACNQVSSTGQAKAARIALPVVKVNVKAENGNSNETHVLLDSGSTNSFALPVSHED